jgi:uncharacterized protein (TIRG00374 family)
VLLAFLIGETGPGVIGASFVRLSWWLLLVLIFPFGLIHLFESLGWRYAFRRDGVPFHALFEARLVGEAVNVVTLTASVGGEAVKAWWLRPYVGYNEGFSSVIIAKTTITIAQGLFLLLGLLVADRAFFTEPQLLSVMQRLLVLEVLAVGLFVLVQVRGIFGLGARILARLGLAGAARQVGAFHPLDHSLQSFYGGHRGRFLLSTACHLVGWALSASETWGIALLLGQPLTMTSAIVIEAFATGIRLATSFVPGGLGVTEGGHAAIFAALGLGAPLGLSISLVRRAREVVWIAVGLVLLLGSRRLLLSEVPQDPAQT